MIPSLSAVHSQRNHETSPCYIVIGCHSSLARVLLGFRDVDEEGEAARRKQTCSVRFGGGGDIIRDVIASPL